MDSLSLSLMILVLFIPLLAFFATAKWNTHDSAPDATQQVKETLHSDFLTNRLQRARSRSVSRDYAPVLRQNVAVARLMRMEGKPLI
jgi:hypothetical protein